MGGKSVNQVDLAEILDVSVVTIRAWSKEGMPVVAAGSRGRPAIYNTADVIRWSEQRSLARVAGDQSAGDKISEDEGRRRKVVADAFLAELKLATERGALVEIEAVGQEVDSLLSKVRTRLLSIPGALALTLTNEPDPAVIRDRVFDQIAEALHELSRSSFAGSEPANGQAGDCGVEEPSSSAQA